MLGTLTQLSTAIWVYDIDNYCIHWANEAALSMWEAESLDELCSRDFKSNTSPAVTQTLTSYQKLFEQNKTFNLFWRYTPKGIQKEAFCQFSGHRMPDGSMGMLVEAVPSYLVEEHGSTASTINLSSYREKTGAFISGNISFIEQMGNSVHHLRDLFSDPKDYKYLMQHIESRQPYDQDVMLNTYTGSKWFSVNAYSSKDKLDNRIVLFHQYDIHERKINEFELQRESLTDPLTGILNRKGLDEKITIAAQNKRELVLFYVDLDGFKLINDTFGHSVGDELLVSFSEKLSTFHHSKGSAARIGGDEFIWYIESQHMDVDEETLGESMVRFLCDPYESSLDIPIMVSASLGGAKMPQNGNTLDALLMAADIAMYKAKQQGRRRCVMYDKSMTKQVARQNQLVQCLHQAITANELQLYYQPIYNVTTGDIIYFEALLRWNNKELGWVMPCEMIQIAEDMGFICELENWVIKQALNDLVELKKMYGERTKMSVNISGIHLTDSNLVPFVRDTIKHLNLHCTDLIIELTESVLVENATSENCFIRKLIELGVDINIDDFGTGYSSLAYINDIPASTVKIDRSFVEQAVRNTELVKCIFNLINSLNMLPLIEGVETREQSDLFRRIGIDLHQGYFHARPQPMSHYRRIHAIQKQRNSESI